MRHGKVQSIKTGAKYSLLKSALPAMEARQISPAQRFVEIFLLLFLDVKSSIAIDIYIYISFMIASGVPRGGVLRREM